MVVGGGPSLDYCDNDIESLISDKTLFVLTDIVARRFISRYKGIKRIIFTVENRYHTYLRGLEGEEIAIYSGARVENVEKRNSIYQFCFDFDYKESANKAMALVSPGTVFGSAVAWLVFIEQFFPLKEIIFFGADFSYPADQSHSRFCLSHLGENYFHREELRQYTGLRKRVAWGQMLYGNLVKTSDEFKKSSQNIANLLKTRKKTVPVIDYSPVGLSPSIVKKTLPSGITLSTQ